MAIRTIAHGCALLLLICSLSCASAQTQVPAVPAAGAAAAPNQAQPQNADAATPRADPASVPNAATLLPRDLSPWGMFRNADIIVKAVMIGLVFASFLTWTVALAKTLEILAAKRRLRAGLRAIGRAPSLMEAGKHSSQSEDLAALVRAALVELNLSADASDKEGVKERVASRLERIEAGVGRRMTRGTGVLASIGSTAPFIGLFGTVWGIMNSFIGISKSHATNLAIVAPGIAEALLATALGLAAAIPAVVVYNVFSRSIAGYRALFADAAAEVLRLVSRDLDREAGRPGAKSRNPKISAAE